MVSLFFHQDGSRPFLVVLEFLLLVYLMQLAFNIQIEILFLELLMLHFLLQIPKFSIFLIFALNHGEASEAFDLAVSFLFQSLPGLASVLFFLPLQFQLLNLFEGFLDFDLISLVLVLETLDSILNDDFLLVNDLLLVFNAEHFGSSLIDPSVI